jgi:hypothetical protein
VGKTTVSTLVADALGVSRVELDEIAMPYYRACPDFDPDTYNSLTEHQGFVAAYRYWEPALAFAVERVVDDHHGAVLDLGAGHSCFLDPACAVRVRRALAPFVNTILLLPDPDVERSVAIIRDRCARTRDGMTWRFDDVDFIRHWVASGQNHELARHVVYTQDDAPEQVAERVVALCAARARNSP